MMRSIRGRFLIVSAASVCLAMVLAAFVFVSLFTRGLERRIDDELTSHINLFAGTLRLTPDGTLELPDRPVDHRFTEPYGGLYWQVQDDLKGRQLRSQSLWDYTLPLPDDAQEANAVHRYILPGPEGADLIVQERKIIIAAPEGPRPIRVAAAIDARVVSEARTGYTLDIIPFMAVLAAFLVAASLAQLTFGLRPVSSVSEGLNRIRERKAERLNGRYPKELQGVVDAVNSLLDAQSEILQKARTRSADLAHGLKTPLTVMANDAQTLKERGQTDIADELAHLVSVMQAHVERELARSRIAATAELRASDADIGLAVDRIVRTLRRTPKGEELVWTVDVPPDVTVEVDPHDLEELLGNILDNAVKWARSNINVTVRKGPDRTRMVIEDDGPGADPAGIKRMTERGIRLDSQTPGTGIGLAIVSDIASVYDLGIEIANRETGGLKVSVSF
ncbi:MULTISPECIES: sensor histidine kinase [Alphaproteobacteria]|uniref:histidine kinase n=2 Tax=Alphaproteobacteria TaxID=28211 RepID=A0A512HF31_9HYPH|nr:MULTISPECIES: sensor histidine kinase [Alphaproteobacteria]GEO84063.1 histidine kinase [Ciceribacter naphthalenivorans]GLR21059.1 histidine kinase [Ciceribacter naphthalenivorans]GLT03915.1 histidine kinase [Sphingomonas psychrolutea]